MAVILAACYLYHGSMVTFIPVVCVCFSYCRILKIENKKKIVATDSRGCGMSTHSLDSSSLTLLFNFLLSVVQFKKDN